MTDGQERRPVGRPTTYSIELASRICAGMTDRNEDGTLKSLRNVCSEEGMPSESTVYRWMVEHEEFQKMYTRAKEDRAHMAADEILQIADTEPDVNRARVRIDTRKWYAGRLNAKHYGDRHTLQGADDAPPIKVQSDINESDKRDLARWIAHTLTSGAKVADAESDT